ncbi:MAG: LPS export ABC transporter periplasmic protein LptC [Pleurocapsa sp. MO_192.B19]|nr:LPS export ABC transporter periplasmic protein LptC [Pleurocapsa sp. MO_192.B19]
MSLGGLVKYLLLTTFVVSVYGCQASPAKQESPSVSIERLDTKLLLNNAILEQSNALENTVWKIKADSILYSEDQKTAALEQVIGNLLQDGKLIFQISAKSGEVRDNGNIIFLKDEIVASDPRNESVVKTDEVEWRPQENLLLIKQDLTAIHPNLEVSAATGKYFTDIESLEIQGDAIATSNDPGLQLKSDRLVWNIPQDIIESPSAMQIVAYNEDETVTERLVADRAKLNLADKTAILNNNIELISLQPSLQIATDFLTWNYQQRVGSTNQPIEILDRDRQISLTGNQGEINLQQQIARLQNGVKGINQQKPSELYARQLTWKIDTEEITATGNVIYEQADPKARLTGEKAIGILGNNKIVVTSDGKKQVTSVIDN